MAGTLNRHVERYIFSPRRRRRILIALAIALVPMLTFMGHWPEDVRIPGTQQYLTVPLAGRSTAESEGAHDHTKHCHGDSASCSDVPALAGAGFAVMNETLAVAITAALLWVVALRYWRPRASNSLLPELQPPRFSLEIA